MYPCSWFIYFIHNASWDESLYCCLIFKYFFGLDSNYVMLSFISVLIGVVQNMSRLECLTEERRHKKWMGKICTELQTDEKVSSNCGWLLLFWLPLNQVLKHTHTKLLFSGLSDDLHFLSFKEFRNRTLGTQCMTLLKATLCVRNREKIITPFQCNFVQSSLCVEWCFCVFMANRVDLF